MIYTVRVYCEEDAQYYYTTQTTLDSAWIPTGHEAHTIRDFTILKTSKPGDSSISYKLTGQKEDPSDIDIRIQGLYRKDTFDNLGALTIKEYYKSYDGTTYSDLVVKDEYVYTYNMYGLVDYRDETLTWYLEDDTVGTTKTFRKYYDSRFSIIEINMRRQNLTDQAQAYGMGNITGAQPDGTLNGHHFFLQIKPELENYLVGVKKEELIDKIQGMTESYLTQVIKDGFCDIFDYWT